MTKEDLPYLRTSYCTHYHTEIIEEFGPHVLDYNAYRTVNNVRISCWDCDGDLTDAISPMECVHMRGQ